MGNRENRETGEEWDQFIARALHAECECDGGELANAVQTQLHVLIAEFIDEHGDRVQILLRIRIGTGLWLDSHRLKLARWQFNTREQRDSIMLGGNLKSSMRFETPP
jgi:hypothetical protein